MENTISTIKKINELRNSSMLARISQKIYSISTLFSKNDDIIDTDEKKDTYY